MINENNSRYLNNNNINNINNRYYLRPYLLNRNRNSNINNNTQYLNPRSDNSYLNDDSYLNDNTNLYLRPSNNNVYLNTYINRREVQLELSEFVIEDINKLEEANRRCMICLEEFKSKEKVTALPCIHFFHPECIKKWVANKNTCPICKFVLTEENINRKLQSE